MGRQITNNNKYLEDYFLKAYDDYSAKILKHAFFRVGNKNLAEDITSETFMKTWQYIRRGQEVKSIKSFLYRVCNNLIIDYYRVKDKEAILMDDVPEIAGTDSRDLENEADNRAAYLDIVRGPLKELPLEHRQIIMYRYVDDLSIGEIRELTGKSAANIYTIIHRGLKALKKNINNEKNA